MTRTFVRFFCVSITSFLFACGGGSDGAGTGPDNSGPGNNNNPPARVILSNPAFGADIKEIFERRSCSSSSCHGAAASADLDLRSGAAYGSLVGVVSFSDEAFQLVTPNDAENSYLVMKVEGRQTVGARMPFNLGVLDNIDITNIRNWINTGAPNN